MTTSRNLRVAYVSASPDPPALSSAGSAQRAHETMAALLRRGATVTLFTPAPGHPTPPAGVRLVRLDLSARAGTDPERAALAANDELATALHREGPFDLIYERCSPFSWIAMNTAGALGAAAVLEVDEVLSGRAGWGPSADWALRQALHDADLVLVASPPVAGWLATTGTSPTRTLPLHPAVDVDRFDLPRLHTPSRFTVGFVGALEMHSGVDVLVEAFLQVARGDLAWHLLLVGGGSLHAALQQRLNARGMTHQATLTGLVAHAEIPTLLTRMHVGVLPGTVATAAHLVPQAALEHLAAGVPLVASRLPQTAALLADGSTAALVPPGDPDALAAALARLRADPALCSDLSARGREQVRRDHSWDRQITAVLTQTGLDIAREVVV